MKEVIMHEFARAEKVVADNFSTVFTKEDVYRLLNSVKENLIGPDVETKEESFTRTQINSAICEAIDYSDSEDLIHLDYADAEFSISGNEISVDYIPKGINQEGLVEKVNRYLRADLSR
jgi:hypothetical protein